ncbi:cyclodeaminase/cyclohydrolase family protein [Rhodococcus sp. NPDC056960]|uniref:cyclodeaminase/cyclohydrolase family protein n=1 Tax=unclassified Rhodococcus (in: high G+C Gram-positive bacteria) TaxID=192944 RepID=UPI00163B205C|nr:MULTISPECIES: cyclodeaminase/cyclohydrolase family protein [unclassified Rhodococcus (in: high G+C Gram-positive bacteria)]MBC2639199.1 cyclodeaminase/cyclohydrolase family protein [Rhodococcus sp. 3A]MBC2896057.1 cyclodeaminase/cyclohydrolase family protein [Rhodococcus sp. 4CII]
MTIRDDTIAGFLDSLAARTPAPGGGATGALHLGQAAALVSMVARYTTGTKYADHGLLVERICAGADAFREKALQFADDDMAAFTAVIDAYRLPRGTDDESASRTAAIASALAGAAAVPAEVVVAAGEVVALADTLLPVANRTVVSDVAAAAEAARAAATTARVNIEVNLPGITDADTRRALTECVAGVDAILERADSVTTRVRKQLSS